MDRLMDGLDVDDDALVEDGGSVHKDAAGRRRVEERPSGVVAGLRPLHHRSSPRRHSGARDRCHLPGC